MDRRAIQALTILLCCIPVSWSYSQGNNSPLDVITGRFAEYCRKMPREEVFIHTDRQTYIAGEELWFKAYVIDRQSNTPSALSSLVYFEILNTENHQVAARRILIENGSGPGYVSLPDTLSSGTYTILAYTNWMKNFFPDNCFRKDIDIYNALNSRSFKERAAAVSGSPENTGDLKKTDASPGSISLRVLDRGGANIRFSVAADRNFIVGNGILCYLVIQTHGNINYAGSVMLTGDSTLVPVPVKSLMGGISQVTIFNAQARPVLDEYIFTPGEDKTEIPLKVSGGKNFRDNISVELELPGKPDQVLKPGDLSISVAPAESCGNQDISDYMIFGSEFGILPEKISARPKNEIPAGEMEEFLSSVRSRWIDWNIILSGKIPSTGFQAEEESHLLRGRLVNIESGSPVPDEYIFMSRPGKTASFRYAKSDKEGFFTFELPVSGVVQDIIIQPERADKNLKIRLESSFSGEFMQSGKTRIVAIDKLPGSIPELSANYQVRKIYGITQATVSSAPLKPMPPYTRFYGKPDASINMDDYIRLPVMQEVFFELLPGVTLKSRKSQYEFSIYELAGNNLDIEPPGMLIDGVIVRDAASIAGLDPELVERIDVIKEPYLVGRHIFYGLINVITRKGDFSCVSLPDYAVRLSYLVTDPVSSFLSPEYSAPQKKQSPIPDFRNTLYWDPSVRPGNDGKVKVGFWTSDYSSDYVISIQGFDDNGEIISLKGSFNTGNTAGR